MMSQNTFAELAWYILWATIMSIVIFGDRLETIEIKRVTEVANGRGGQYLVFTKDGEVYENDDTILYTKFNSSDLQAQMSPGDCYRARVVGYRVQFLSWYPNIIQLFPCEK